MTPDIPSPAGDYEPDYDPGHRDLDRPSLRVRLAAVLLRQGNTPAEVARVTAVPLALIELIAEHLDPQPPTRDAPSDTVDQGASDPSSEHAPTAAPRPAIDEHADDGPRRPTRPPPLGRRFRWTARAVLMAFLLNAALAVTAALTHTHTAAEGSLIAGSVIAAVWLTLLRVHTHRTATRIAQIGSPPPG